MSTATAVLAEGQTPRCFGQDADHLYWLDESGRFKGIDKRGGPVVESRFDTRQAMPPLERYPSSPNGATCSIAVEGNYAYMTMWGLGKLAKLSLSTNGVWQIGDEAILFGELDAPLSLAMDESWFYVGSSAGTIKRVSRITPDGGTGPLTEQLLAGGGPGADLVSDATTLYWFSQGGLRSMAKTGGSVRTLATAVGSDLRLGGGVLFWRYEAPVGLYASMNQGDEYGRGAPADAVGSVRTSGDGEVSHLDWRTPQASCPDNGYSYETETKRLRGGDVIGSVASDGHDVFFTTSTGIHRSTIPGGPVSEIFAYHLPCNGISSGNMGALLVVDDARLFWVENEKIFSHPK